MGCAMNSHQRSKQRREIAYEMEFTLQEIKEHLTVGEEIPTRINSKLQGQMRRYNQLFLDSASTMQFGKSKET